MNEPMRRSRHTTEHVVIEAGSPLRNVRALIDLRPQGADAKIVSDAGVISLSSLQAAESWAQLLAAVASELRDHERKLVSR